MPFTAIIHVSIATFVEDRLAPIASVMGITLLIFSLPIIWG